MSYRSGLLAVATIALSAVSLTAHAQGADKRVYVAPLFSYTLSDKDRGTDDGLGMQLSVGKRMTTGLDLEFTGFLNNQDWHNGGNGTAQLAGFGVGALIFPTQKLPGIFGVLALQEGFAQDIPGQVKDYKSTVFDMGVGYLWPINLQVIGLAEGTSLRFEGRYRMDAHWDESVGLPGGDKHFYDGVFNVGLQIPLGNLPHAPEEAPVQTAVVAAPVDSDGDGVVDEKDQCPNTPEGAKVDENGCELDEDGDGVVDRLDKCPGTPPGTPVDENGCPLPVPVKADNTNCKEPAPGQPITLEGCASGDAIVLRGVTFNFNEATLTANAKVILDQVADALIAAPAIIVEIGGHTDSVGGDAYNQKLSEKRAIAVYDYLVSRGIANKRMTYRGYGKAQPIATNDTDEGRELNRRVELKVLGD